MHRKVFGQEEGRGLLQHPQLVSMPWTRRVRAGLQQQRLLGGDKHQHQPMLGPHPAAPELSSGLVPCRAAAVQGTACMDAWLAVC